MANRCDRRAGSERGHRRAKAARYGLQQSQGSAMRNLSLPCVLIALSLPVACAQAADVDVDMSCNMDSDYDLTIDERSVILTRDSGVPKAIVMRQGKLFV